MKVRNDQKVNQRLLDGDDMLGSFETLWKATLEIGDTYKRWIPTCVK